MSRLSPCNGWLGRPGARRSWATDAVAALGQNKHLVVESVGAERPITAEHDRLSAASVVEIDLVPSAVEIVPMPKVQRRGDWVQITVQYSELWQ